MQEPDESSHTTSSPFAPLDSASPEDQTRAPEEPPARPAGPGLYAVLGLAPDATDEEIQTAYRTMARRLAESPRRDERRLRQLNAAYSVLGYPDRRAEYDAALNAPRPPVRERPLPPPTTARNAVVRRPLKRSRGAGRAQGGLGEVAVVVLVLGLTAVIAFAIVPRIPIDLSWATPVLRMAGLGNSSSGSSGGSLGGVRIGDLPPITAPSPSAQGTSVANDFRGSKVAVSSGTPQVYANLAVTVTVVQGGKPAINAPVWLRVQYRTQQERWPQSGAELTDGTGTAQITFNIGGATPDYRVPVIAYTYFNNQDTPVATTSFVPHQ